MEAKRRPLNMKIKKTFFYSLLTLQLFTFFTPSTVAAQSLIPNAIESNSSIYPKVDDIRWQYKMEGNTVYRRLFNYSTNTPVSDWEPVT